MRALGQKVNREKKKKKNFSKSTPQDMQILIKYAIGVPLYNTMKYISICHPLWAVKRRECFDNIKQWVWKKLQDWEGKLLFQASREILIKAVAQALPTYSMSCFKLLLGFCQYIESLIKRFFQGQKGDSRKIHWVKWQEPCKPKTQGGMSFKDLAIFNDAHLTKQAWHLLHDTYSLFYQVFKAKFFPNCSIMEATIPSSSLNAWKSIIKGREVNQRGVAQRIGNGKTHENREWKNHMGLG